MNRLPITQLSNLLRQELTKYAGEGFSIAGSTTLYCTENLQDQVYCVVAPYNPVFKKTDLVVMARIVDTNIIIDVDKTNKPLHDALRQNGVPDEQITLAWQAVR